MKRRNIIKALALAMLLTTACVNNEIPNENGYALPVTVNVTRQGNDPATRATYNDGTHELGFSTGDKLFVNGQDGGKTGVGFFAGTLDMVSDGVFSGTIYTEQPYSGTADALFTTAASTGFARATLLPNGYESKDFFTLSNVGTYSAEVTVHRGETFSTSKAEAIEQFSYEYAGTYSSGFSLSPQNAILDFTISGLTPTTTVNVSLAEQFESTISGNVATDASGTATFVMAKFTGNLGNCTFTVGGNDITIVAQSPAFSLTPGKIYNIYRDATIPHVDLSKIDGSSYEVTGDVILTGTPMESTFDINFQGDHTVTLNNVNSGGRIYLWGNGYNVTIKLKGTSILYNINTLQAGVYYPVTIGEAVAGGTLIINSNTTAITASTVTIDGGTVIFNSNNHYALFASLTVNGGTVKARSNSNNWKYAINGNLVVNDGAVYLAGCDYNAVNGTISGSATLYGWNGSAWDATTGVQYVTTDNSAAPSTWTW